MDALNDEDLGRLGEALRDSPFLTAGSGLGDSLPRNWGFSPRNRASLPPARGLKAILAGSCSVATNAQVQRFIRDGGEAYALAAAQLAADFEMQIAQVLAWADACWRSEAGLPLLVYSTAEPEQGQRGARTHGRTGHGGAGARVRASAALAAWWSPAEKQRAFACRLWISGKCRLARRLILACPGATPRPRRADSTSP